MAVVLLQEDLVVVPVVRAVVLVLLQEVLQVQEVAVAQVPAAVPLGRVVTLLVPEVVPPDEAEEGTMELGVEVPLEVAQTHGRGKKFRLQYFSLPLLGLGVQQLVMV